MSSAGDEITCRELVELITEYLDGALPTTDRERFEAHLATCEACRAYLAQMRGTIAATGTISEDSLPPALRDALLEAFRDWKLDRRM